MAKMFRTPEFLSPVARLSFAQDLFTAKKGERDNGEKYEQYGCTLIFDNTHKPALAAMVEAAIRGEWGDKGMERAKQGLIKLPILAGDGKEARNKETGELHPGMGADKFFIRPTANYAPAVLWKSQHVPATPQEVYSGCFGKAVLVCFAWHNQKNGDGVSFGISMFQKKEEGDRIGGGGPLDTSKWFEKVEDAGEAPAETKGGAGAGGLFG